jgi:hypothetical protein
MTVFRASKRLLHNLDKPIAELQGEVEIDEVYQTAGLKGRNNSILKLGGKPEKSQQSDMRVATHWIVYDEPNQLCPERERSYVARYPSFQKDIADGYRQYGYCKVKVERVYPAVEHVC